MQINKLYFTFVSNSPQPKSVHKKNSTSGIIPDQLEIPVNNFIFFHAKNPSSSRVLLVIAIVIVIVMVISRILQPPQKLRRRRSVKIKYTIIIIVIKIDSERAN